MSEVERHLDISQASDQAVIELCGYRLQPSVPTVVPATVRREWMDQTSDRFAARCLPMMLANHAGWFVLNRTAVRLEVEPQTVQYHAGEVGPPAAMFINEDVAWRECGIIEWAVA